MSTAGGTELMHRPMDGLARPVANAAEIVDAHKEVVDLIEKALKQGEDYGIIPGTSRKVDGKETARPTLLKPGAERLSIAFGVRPEFEVVTQEIDHDRAVRFTKKSWKWGQRRGEKVWEVKEGESLGLYRYVLKCKLMRGDRVMGEGVGSCSSMESKYIDRPRDCENTILKMAKKRAHVDAVLSMAGLSNRFTQDVEDMPGVAPADDVRDEPPPPAEPDAPAKPVAPKPAEPKPPAKPKIATEVIALKVALKAAAVSSREGQLRFCAAIVGRDIASSLDLTPDELEACTAEAKRAAVTP